MTPVPSLSSTVISILLLLHLSEQCTPTMTTFIAYQARGIAPSFGSHTSCKSSTVGLPGWVSSRQSSESPHQATPVSNTDFVELVDLTASDQNDAREYLVAREILEPMGHDPGKCGVRMTTDRSSGAADN